MSSQCLRCMQVSTCTLEFQLASLLRACSARSPGHWQTSFFKHDAEGPCSLCKCALIATEKGTASFQLLCSALKVDTTLSVYGSGGPQRPTCAAFIYDAQACMEFAASQARRLHVSASSLAQTDMSQCRGGVDQALADLGLDVVRSLTHRT